jgi:zinc-ribbon domain
MYANKMAVAIKTNGRVLREHNKDTVFVKFGSEYSVYMKNLNTQRAIVNVFIDGTNIVEGGLVLNAGQEVDLERSIANGNLNAGNKLKFIERTGAIEQGPRGIKLEDGLIRIEFQYELPRPIINTAYDNFRFSGISGMGKTYTSSSYNVNGIMRGVDYSAGESMKASATSAINSTLQSMNIGATSAHDGMATMDWMDAEMPRSKNDVGITVPGSRSDQKFTHTTMGTLDPEKHTIVLKILGETPDNKPVTEAVTVKKKPKCVTCGKQNKATAKFCSECGTALEIFA